MDDEERDVTTKASTTADRPTSIVATNIIKDEMLIAEVPLPAVDFLRTAEATSTIPTEMQTQPYRQHLRRSPREDSPAQTHTNQTQKS